MVRKNQDEALKKINLIVILTKMNLLGKESGEKRKKRTSSLTPPIKKCFMS